jgi:hypothetical protein
MPNVTVKFVNPIDERVLEVVIDDAITAQDAINELLANRFVPPSPTGYQLNVNDELLRDDQTLASGGVVDYSKIRVMPATDAGAQKGRPQ